MERAELTEMHTESLRALARARGLDGADELPRAELIERLAPGLPSSLPGLPRLIERAQLAIAHVAETVEARARHFAERLRARPGRAADVPAADAARGEATRGEPRGNGGRRLRHFDVPSATVHPHAPPAPEPLGLLDLEELPAAYGLDECELLPRDPHTVFVYWEVTAAGLEAARAQLGPSGAAAKLMLRLFTTLALPDGVERELRDVDPERPLGQRYLPAPRAGAHLRAAIGLLSPEGYFAPIAHSSLVRVPPAGPQPGVVEWMEVVPARRRGQGREPLVIVRRGGAHQERGLDAAGLDGEGPWGGASATAAPAAPAERHVDWPPGASPAGSSPVGSSPIGASPTRRGPGRER